MTKHDQRQLRRIVDDTHIGSVLHELSVICRERAAHAKATPDRGAIAGEWERGAQFIDKAIEEIGE